LAPLPVFAFAFVLAFVLAFEDRFSVPVDVRLGRVERAVLFSSAWRRAARAASDSAGAGDSCLGSFFGFWVAFEGIVVDLDVFAFGVVDGELSVFTLLGFFERRGANGDEKGEEAAAGSVGKAMSKRTSMSFAMASLCSERSWPVFASRPLRMRRTDIVSGSLFASRSSIIAVYVASRAGVTGSEGLMSGGFW